MDFAGSVDEVPGGLYAVVVAAVTGLLGVTLLLCCTLSRGGREEKEAARRRPLSSVSESEGEDTSEGKPKQQQSRSKSKQPSGKKITLPPHPLLAAEFKGHTGAVLSLDFDTNGKYLASCSDGGLHL